MRRSAETLRSLSDDDLAVEGMSRNPRWGLKPASFVVDHGGRVVWAANGMQPDGALALAAEATLNAPPSPAVPTVAAQR